MKNSSRPISGLDIQREYISVAQYSQEDNAVELVAIHPVSLINGSDLGEQLGDELKELKSKFKFTSPDIVCSIPSEHAIVKYLTVDTTDINPLDSLEWELSQQIIGSIKDYVFDFQEYDTRPDDTRHYLAVAYRKDTVQSISSALKRVRLNPLIVDLDVFALINVLEVNYPERIELPSVIIHSENNKTKLILTKKGVYIDYECIEYENGLPDPDNLADLSKSEIDKLLSLNNQVIDNNISIFCTGSLFGQSSYNDAIVNGLGSVELLNPFRKIECRVGVNEDKLKTYISQLAVAVGLAYRGNN